MPLFSPPTLALEQNGQLQLLDISPWLGKPDAFVEWLRDNPMALAQAKPGRIERR